MPRYQYKCNSCKQEFEVDHKLGVDLKECLSCGKPGPVKVIGAVPFIAFDGSYKKDNRKN